MITAASDGAIMEPILRHVVHPSDFTEASRTAFAHALKAALIAKGKLSLIHETNDETRDWSDFPGVQETLERWGILPAGSLPEAVDDLGIDVARVIGSGSDPVKGVLRYLDEQGADVIVLATHHQGSDWLHKSIAEPVARKSNEMTLFVPASGRGFISLDDGTVSLRHVLIPIAESPAPQAAISGAVRLVRQLKCERGKFTLLHVGEKEPALDIPIVAGWGWDRLHKRGNVIDVILQTAQETEADVIVMSTQGHHGFLDALRGSHSERVLRHAPCPLLAIPTSSHAAANLVKADATDWYQQSERRTKRRSMTNS
ncbi:MAG: universal stress protein [Chthoniobacterales bacterium]